MNKEVQVFKNDRYYYGDVILISESTSGNNRDITHIIISKDENVIHSQETEFSIPNVHESLSALLADMKTGKYDHLGTNTVLYDEEIEEYRKQYLKAISENETKVFRNDNYFEGDVILEVAVLNEKQLDIKATILRNEGSDLASRIDTATIENKFNSIEEVFESLKDENEEGHNDGCSVELNEEEASELHKTFVSKES